MANGGIIGAPKIPSGVSAKGIWTLEESRLWKAQHKWLAYKKSVAVDAPVGLWLLNETQGTAAADSGGNALNGTYTGGYTLNQPGPPGVEAAVGLNGSSGYINLGAPAALNLTAAWHLEAWVYLTSTPNGAGVITEEFTGSGNILYELGFGLNGGGANLNVGYLSGGSWYLIAGGSLSLNVWHLVAGEYNGTALTLYADGAQVATGTPAAAPTAGISNAIFIGRRHATDTTPYLAGRLSAAAIYGSAIGLARHQAHYNAGK